MKILATGKNGTIGRYLPQNIVDINFRNLSSKSQFVQVSELEPFSVIHLAGVVGEKRVLKNLNESQYVNVTKTVDLANYCMRKNLTKFLYISTSHVYSKSEKPISESSKLEPLTEYAKQKLSAEKSLTKIFEDFPEKLCILRVFSVLSLESGEDTLGATLMRSFSDPDAKVHNVDDQRDFLHPRQIAEIILKLAHIENLPPIINICSGIPMSIRDAIQVLSEHKELSINPQQLVGGHSDYPKILGDATLLKDILQEVELRFICSD